MSDEKKGKHMETYGKIEKHMKNIGIARGY